MNDVKVYGLATVGAGLPLFNRAIENLGPVLDVVLKFSQLGIAIVTILYIYAKWKALRDAKKDDDNDPV